MVSFGSPISKLIVKTIFTFFILPDQCIDIFNLILLLNIGFIIFFGLFRVRFVRKSISHKRLDIGVQNPFVSIHLAICNEPPSIVIDTIKSILELDYERYELIIISNNTSNVSSWQPVEAFAKTNKNKIKFYHYDKVEGNKAGALNIALEKMSLFSKYIFTVDADYKLNRKALQIAVSSIIEQNVDLLQFPQDYRNSCDYTEGLKLHYKHYFECYLSSKESQNFGLPTGTLTLVKARIFREGLKWPTETITEDAHFGVELLSKNFTIGFSNISIGKGAMPTTVLDYNKQLKRWVFGNFQTVGRLLSKRIGFKKKLHLLTMLTAWLNLLAIPTFCIYLITFIAFTTDLNMSTTAILVCISVLIHLVFQFYILFVTAKYDIRKAFKALLVHISTLEIGSFYWLLYFFNQKKPFVRTNKYLVANSLPNTYFLIPTSVFILATISMLLSQQVVGLLFLFISIVLFIGKLQLISEIYHSKFNYSKLLNP